jgi:hypothetical protein
MKEEGEGVVGDLLKAAIFNSLFYLPIHKGEIN